MTRSEVVEKFLPYINAGKKVSDDYFEKGIFFIGKYGYIINKNCIGRIKVDDRILPMQPLMWDYEAEECLPAPQNTIDLIKGVDFEFREPAIFLRTKDIAELFKDLTPKRENKSVVTMTIENGNIIGRTIRKGDLIAEKNFSSFRNTDFIGKIQINMFDLKKIVLEIFSDYDIIGVQSRDQIRLFGRRLDKAKPTIDFIAKGG